MASPNDFFAPHNAKADQDEPSFDGQTVKTIAEVKTAWKQFADAGLLCAQHDYELGGYAIANINQHGCECLLHVGKSIYSVAYSFLTAAAANVIQAFLVPLNKKYVSFRICSVVVFQARWH